MTFKSDPGEISRHRFVSKNLPVRNTREEAQSDLDAYATKGHLIEYKESDNA